MVEGGAWVKTWRLAVSVFMHLSQPKINMQLGWGVISFVSREGERSAAKRWSKNEEAFQSSGGFRKSCRTHLKKTQALRGSLTLNAHWSMWRPLLTFSSLLTWSSWFCNSNTHSSGLNSFLPRICGILIAVFAELKMIYQPFSLEIFFSGWTKSFRFWGLRE